MYAHVWLSTYMVRYTFFISEELREGLRALTVRDGIGESEAIRRAIAGFLEERNIKVSQPKKERSKRRR